MGIRQEAAKRLMRVAKVNPTSRGDTEAPSGLVDPNLTTTTKQNIAYQNLIGASGTKTKPNAPAPSPSPAPAPSPSPSPSSSPSRERIILDDRNIQERSEGIRRNNVGRVK